MPHSAQAASSPVDACSAPLRPSAIANDSVPDLAGIWDFSVQMGSRASSGTMALGHLEDYYAGALTPDATNTVVIKKLTLHGDSVHMVVASREGDVFFYGWLDLTGHKLCGIVAYDNGARYPMTAAHRTRPR